MVPYVVPDVQRAKKSTTVVESLAILFLSACVLLHFGFASAQEYVEPKWEGYENAPNPPDFEKVRKKMNNREGATYATSVDEVASRFNEAIKNRDHLKYYEVLSSHGIQAYPSTLRDGMNLFNRNSELTIDTKSKKTEISSSWEIKKYDRPPHICVWKEVTRVAIKDRNGVIKTYAYVKCKDSFPMQQDDNTCPKLAWRALSKRNCTIDSFSGGTNGAQGCSIQSGPARN